uniref:EOG090X032R n=1 Tax=Daphnia pulex TaxID=6669 RepID=A0A4Y7MVT9_DAPPU|nr:EOG090X032R [Daphnia pulex]SVE84767.1 EOG090X032R [Daphnia pulex]
MVKGKKADTTGVKLNSIQAGAENSSSQTQSQPSQAQKSLKDLDETPPPSRSPSPPPSPPPSPTHSARSRESQWSIDIEELSDEPRSAVPTKKDNKRPDRRRSSSWSRSLMNSFRKKKNKEANLEALYKTGPLPDYFPANADEELDLTVQSIEPAGTVVVEERTGPVENVQIDESMEETKTSGPVQDEAAIVAETRTKAPSVERSTRMSKMLSFGTFGRRKSMTAPQEQSKSDHQESESQENPEIEVEAEQEKKPESKLKPKADKKGKHDEVDGESGEVKSEGKTKSNKREKSKSKERKSMKNEKEKSEENIQVIDEIQIEAGSVPIPTVAKIEEKEKSKSSLKKPTVAKVEEKEKSKSLKKPSIDKVEEKEEKKSKSSSKKPTTDKKEKESKSSVKKSKSNHKSIFSFKVKSVEQVQPEMDVEEVQLTDQEPESTSNAAVTKSESPPSTKVKPKRKSIADLFKREKSIKEEEIPTESASELPPSKKAGMFRNSFARSKKTKSMDVETISHEEIPENDKKTRRSTSVAFGSSFSLKKMFHGDSPSDLVDQTPESKGILNKRSKKTSSARPKSVQLDGNPLEIENVPVNSQTELRSSRSKFGERFMSFTRDSLRIKKQQRSKSDDRVLAEVADETLPMPIAIEAEDKNVTAPNATEVMQEGMRTNAIEIPANPVAESVTPEVQVDEAVILSTLHLDYEPKHALVSSSPPTSPDENPSDVHSNIAIANPSSLLDAPRQLENPTPDGPQKAVAVSTVEALREIFLVETLGEVLGQLKTSPSSEGAQLREIFENPHLTALLETHDAVTERLPSRQGSVEESPFGDFDPYSWEMPADISDVRAVGIRKNPGEPLGLTVKTEDGQLVIARILAGGAVDRQGLLHVGDIIGEVNGIVVRSAEQLQVEIARCREHIQLKILPSFQENGSNGAQCCVRAHFDYDPKEDKLLPCPEIGLAFKKGDILQVVNQSDPNWWQAKKVGWSGPAGLIPSQELEERRKAFVAPEADFVHKIGFCGTRISKKKKKLMYQIKSSVDLDKAELLLYEEVTRMPPFRRKTLVLVGSEGIGRRTLKNRLINSDPDRFGTTMPHTSRPMRELEEDGMGYWFVSREEMEHDVRDHQFLEFGEHNNHIYGTKLDTIRAVIRQGKMCVLDCSPNALKTLHNSPEFMPYVIFLAAPGMDQLKSLYENSRYSSRNLGTFDRSSSIRFSSRRARTLESLTSLYEEEDFKNALEESARIQRIYEKYFDQIIINEDPDQTFRKVVEALEILSNQHQWVPVSWVY